MKVQGVIKWTGEGVFIIRFKPHTITVQRQGEWGELRVGRGDVSISERELIKISLFELKLKL